MTTGGTDSTVEAEAIGRGTSAPNVGVKAAAQPSALNELLCTYAQAGDDDVARNADGKIRALLVIALGHGKLQSPLTYQWIKRTLYCC
jgi:hypothetical protein